MGDASKREEGSIKSIVYVSHFGIIFLKIETNGIMKSPAKRCITITRRMHELVLAPSFMVNIKNTESNLIPSP